MKKIDLHIHTVPTISDSPFVFSLETFRRYVEDASLDAVAITNHDMFDGAQFKAIRDALRVTVFPGIEINVAKGHLLIISNADDLDGFQAKADLVTRRIVRPGDSLTIEELLRIYGDLGNYLVIPHYEKAPPITGQALEDLAPYVCAGEVDSAKKFLRVIKDASRLTPVLFTDARMMTGLGRLPTRQTYVDCGSLTIGSLKTCLRDRAKVALSERDGNKLWQIFENGQKLSTGLNVLVGARSTGKSHTLDEIYDSSEGVKYIRQFSLVQQDDATSDREFSRDVERQRSIFADEYLAGLKRILDDVMNVETSANERALDQYLETLLRSAVEADRHDAFSKAALFDETEFALGRTERLSELIGSVRQVIENVEFRPIIEKHVDLGALKALAIELIELLWAKTLDGEKKREVNGLVREIKKGLKLRTAAVQVSDVDFYKFCMDRKRVQRFVDVVSILRKPAVIFEETIQGFRIVATREPYVGAGEIRAASGVKSAFSIAYGKYDQPYEYLQELLAIDGVSRSDLYKLFVKIHYRILNRDGFEVSGGERSEFRLLQQIADAQNYNILLIDEPESSFDNLFLKSDVNQILKAIAESMPVVVVTHNSTVGVSVNADYLLHTRKEIENGKICYRIYSGYPTDKQLRSVDGRVIDTHEIIMDSLEAGSEAYDGRRRTYEAIKN